MISLIKIDIECLFFVLFFVVQVAIHELLHLVILKKEIIKFNFSWSKFSLILNIKFKKEINIFKYILGTIGVPIILVLIGLMIELKYWYLKFPLLMNLICLFPGSKDVQSFLKIFKEKKC